MLTETRARRREAIAQLAVRPCLALRRPGVTGVLGTPDVIEAMGFAAAVDTAGSFLARGARA